MKALLLFALFLGTSTFVKAAPQDARPPLSRDEVIDMLRSRTPDKVMISFITESGIAFQPTPQVLEELRKAGADRNVLAALRGAWHQEIPKPLSEKDILFMLGADSRSESIANLVRERGIDFLPTGDYLAEIGSQGAQDILIQTLRNASPRPFSRDEILQLLRNHAEQNRLAVNIQARAIDFAPDAGALQTLRAAGAGAPLLQAIRTARQVTPFVPQSPIGAAPAQVPPPLEGHMPATLICESSDHDVPVFADAGDLGNIIARLGCGEQVTFLERTASPPGFDRIQFRGSAEGVVSNSYLEFAIATPGGDVSAPVPISKPDPQYTPEAARAKLEGVVKLSIVIDTVGNVVNVQEISPPLGLGLDSSAINTVKKWKFSPSMRSGNPVAVRAGVEMTFRMRPDAP